MKLSIITCTYNSERYLQDTINSVVAQNLDSSLFEHIFVDGYSTDTTLDIIEQHKSQNPDYKIKVIKAKPKWIYNAMNAWIKIAKGEYITFLNSDDYYNSNMLNDYLQFIDGTWHKDFYYWINNIVDQWWNFLYTYPNRSIYKKWLNPYLLSIACYVSQSSTLYKKSLHEQYGLYDENLKLVSDAKFFTILAQNKISHCFYNHIVANFREHDGSASNNHILQEQENNKVRKELFGKVLWLFLNQFYVLAKKLVIK